MSTPLFSVIIPVYNRSDYLRQALESVVRQTFRDFEVIVVDDGSTEDLSPIQREFAEHVRFVRQANQGPGAARNLGASLARGVYLAFLDSDDLWFPWTLHVCSKVVEECSEAGILVNSGRWFHDINELSNVEEAELKYSTYEDFFASSGSELWIGSAGMVVQRSRFDRCGGFIESLRAAEDLDLTMRLGEGSKFTVIEQPVTFGYRQHNGNSIHHIKNVLFGAFHLIQSEKFGIYPGGARREVERLRILGRFLRPPGIAAIRNGHQREGWRVYFEIFFWNVRLARLKFLLGFPLLSVMAGLKRKLIP